MSYVMTYTINGDGTLTSRSEFAVTASLTVANTSPATSDNLIG